MRAHVIENGIVVNTVSVADLNDLPGLVEATAGGIGWTYENGVFAPPPELPETIPQTVSPRQFRQALTRAGLRTQVDAAVAAADQDTQDWWEYATSIERANAPLNAMAQALGVSDAALDDLFRTAGAL